MTAELPEGLGPPLAPESWQTWWDLHESSIVGLRAAVRATRVTTPSGDGGGSGFPEVLIRERILPALLEELDRAPGAERTSAVLLALGRIGDRALDHPEWSSTFALLVDHLDHADRSVTGNAALALGVLGAPSAAPVLVGLLQDSEAGRTSIGRGSVPDVLRARAAYALGLVAEGSRITDLRTYASRALVAAARAEEPAIDVQVAAIAALGVAWRADGPAPEEVVAVLSELLADTARHDFVRAQAGASLGRLGAGASAEARALASSTVLAVLDGREASQFVRRGILRSLGPLLAASDGVDAVRGRALLLDAMRSGDAPSRAFATLACADLAREESISGTAPAERESIESLLRRELAQSKALDRPWLALALGLVGRRLSLEGRELEPESASALSAVVGRERSRETLPALVLAAGLASVDGVRERLLAELDHAADGSYAALGLGFLGGAGGIEVLRAELEEADHRPLRMNRIASALALLGDAELVPELLRILARCGCDRSSVTLAYTLGHTGDARVVGPLIAMLDDEAASDRKRAWASYALGLAADRRELPWVARYATQVDYLDAPPSLMSPYGGALLDQR